MQAVQTMTNAVNSAYIIEEKSFRERYISHKEVLDKVKKILLIPKMECLTTSMVAEYFGVDVEVIQKCYQRNKEEIESDGVKVRDYNDFKLGLNVQPKQMPGRGAGYEFDIGNGIKFIIPRGFGVKTFSKRAVLRIAMLLRDSEVAKEIRTQLLNVFEKHEKESLIQKEISKYNCGSVWYWMRSDENPNSDRPIIIVANENRNEGFACVTALLITRTERGWASETPIVIKDGIQSFIQGDQIHSIPIRSLGTYFGDASEEVILDIKNKLMVKLGLTKAHMSELNCIVKIKQRYKDKHKTK